ncbi:MAG TPA: apolipoprotein N-acyltransferase [Anaeromyxobacteraceae bacterium]
MRIRMALLAVASGLLMALALPQCFPWLSLREIDPAGHLEWLSWVALVPALLALDRASTWKAAFGVGLAAGLAYFYAAIWWVDHAMTAFGGVPLPVALVGLSLLVLFMAVHWAAALAASWLVRWRLGWPWWMHLPATWTAAELSRNYLFTGFPWGNLGYLQARHLPVAQLAAVAGVYGIAALVVLVNCAAHALVRARLDGRRLPWRLAAATALVLAAVVTYGELHLAAVRARSAAARRLSVALVQGNVNQSVKNERMSYGAFILGRYLPLTLEADRRGVDLVAWPEASYPFLLPPDPESLADRRAGLPPLRHAHLLLGAGTYDEHMGRGGKLVAEGSNSVFMLEPDLEVKGRYAKHHLVPFGEYVPLQDLLGSLLRSVVPQMVPQRPGAELRALTFTPTATVTSTQTAIATSTAASIADPSALSVASPEATRSRRAATPTSTPTQTDARAREVRLAPMICFDAIFPEVNVAFAAQDPDLLVNPTNDAWYGYSSGPYQFLAMVRMRAIEAGKAVARPAYAGVSALIEPTGEVQPGALPVGPVDPDLAPDPEEPPRLLVGDLPLLRGRTLYTTVGDLFAYVASAWAAVALALALRRPRAPRESSR